MTNGDLMMISGPNNLLQALGVMIDTPFGSDVFNIQYGFDLTACLSTPQPVPVVKELIRLNIVKTLTSDARIRQIQQIAFDDEAAYYTLSPESDPEANLADRKASRRWRAIALVDMVQEGSAAIQLEGPRP